MMTPAEYDITIFEGADYDRIDTWKKVSTAVLHAVHIEVGDFISGVRDTHMEQDILLDNANEATLQGYNVEAIVWQL